VSKLRAASAALFDRTTRLLPVGLRATLARKFLAGLPATTQFQMGALSMGASLHNLARNGYQPALVIDVGAHKGDWTLLAAGEFPAARLVMVEADREREPRLREVVGLLPGRVGLTMTLLGPEARADVRFFSMGMGSSVMEELTSAPRTEQHLPMQTLDAVVAASGGAPAGAPVLLKLDVQGYELEVLRGGTQTLAASDVLIAELSLLEYNRGAPLMNEVIAYLDARGFVPYDLAGTVRRYEDSALFQVDMVFVRKDHALRARKAFWKGA
jgi:FkbM family methyltransferase